MRSCDQTWNGDVGIIGQFMDRRHHLHLRQLGGNLKNGKNDMNGNTDKTGTDGGNGKNEYSFPEPSVILQDLCTFVEFLTIARTHIRECRAHDGR